MAWGNCVIINNACNSYQQEQWNQKVHDVWIFYNIQKVTWESNTCTDHENSKNNNTAYRVIFAPCNFRPSKLANSFAPSWIHSDTVVFKEK